MSAGLEDLENLHKINVLSFKMLSGASACAVL
jgi:hypothetical protein